MVSYDRSDNPLVQQNQKLLLVYEYDTYILEPIFVVLNEDFPHFHPFPGESAVGSRRYRRRRS